MGRKFDVEYDDFSGGYFIGPVNNAQPRNTWRGDNIMATSDDGYLMPASEMLAASSAFSTTNVGRLARGSVAGANTLFMVDKGTAGTTTAYVHTISSFPTVTTTTQTAATPGASVAVDDAQQQRSPLVRFGSNAKYYCGGWDNGAATFAQIGEFEGAVAPVWYDTPFPAGNHVQCVSHNDFMCLFTRTTTGSQRHRFYYSAPQNATSWTSSNYYDVGNPNWPIRAMVSRGGDLYIGKDEGWWVLTGVLGTTASLRKIAHRGPSTAVHPVPSTFGFFYPSTEVAEPFASAQLRLLRGSTVEPLMYWPYPVPDGGQSAHVRELVRVGDHIVADGQDGTSLFIFNEMSRRWRRVLRPADSTFGAVTYFTPCENLGAAQHVYLVKGEDKTIGTASNRLYRHELEPVEPPVTNAGAFTSGSATLAEYAHKQPFIIEEVIAQLDLGYTTTNSTRSITTQMFTPGAPFDAGISYTTLSARASTAQTFTLPAASSTNREKVWVRFKPNDGGHTMSVDPTVTLQGCKLVRLILRCQEV